MCSSLLFISYRLNLTNERPVNVLSCEELVTFEVMGIEHAYQL